MGVRTALVTGASTGIGNAAVQRLAKAGWRVFASVRKPEDAQRLLDAAPQRGAVVPLVFDITDDAGAAAAARRIEEETGSAGLNALVNNAGIAIAGPLEFLPIDELVRQLDVNVTGHVRVTQKLMPSLRRANGRIVFVGSIAGRSALPFTGAYCASKFAIEAIADSLRLELMPWEMHVTVVEPGVVITPIWDTATRAADLNLGRMPAAVNDYYGPALNGLRKRQADGMKGASPDDVARVIESALNAKRPRARYVVGNDARLRTILRKLPTPLHDRLIAFGVRMMEKSAR